MDATFTRVPDVVAALVALATTVLNPEPETPEDDPPFAVTVLDGPPTGQDVPDDVLVVGVGNEDNSDPYRTTRVRDSFDLGGRSRELGTIRCHAGTWSGGTDIAALRAKVIAWMETLEAAFRTDQQLNATCDLIRMGSARWYNLQHPNGAAVGVDFDVEYEAWL